MNPLIKSPKFSKKFDFASKHWINENLTLKIPQEFPTIPMALSYLNDKVWSKATTVTLLIDSGIYDVTSFGPIRVIHDIVLEGKTTVTKTITGLVSTTGSAGNWSLTYNVSDIIDLKIGMLINIPYPITGTGDCNHHRGCWEITDLPTSTRITIKNTNKKATFTSTVTAGTINVPLTQLKTTSDFGIFYFENCSAEIKNIALKGNSTTINYSNTAITLSNSQIIAENVKINRFYIGAYSTSTISRIFPPVQATPMLSISNCVQGINGAIMSKNRSIQTTGCIEIGTISVLGNTISIIGIESCFLGNGTDIIASNGGYIHLRDSIYETTSPAINTVGNGNSYINST